MTQGLNQAELQASKQNYKQPSRTFCHVPRSKGGFAASSHYGDLFLAAENNMSSPAFCSKVIPNIAFWPADFMRNLDLYYYVNKLFTQYFKRGENSNIYQA